MAHVPPRLSPREMAASLRGVQRTLLVSLLARHLASTRPESVISDPAASALITQLGLAQVHVDWSFQAAVAAAEARTVIIDAAVRSFAESGRRPTVITVGAGLCTRCVRLGDLDADWIDVDFPEVAALRAALLPPGPNRVVIGESALDAGWRDRVAAVAGPRLFVLEGLTMYLDEAAVRDLISGLAGRCPGSHLLIETAGPRVQPPGLYRRHGWPGQDEARYRWGVRRLSEVTRWHRRLELIDSWYLMDHHPAAWPALVRAIRPLPGVRGLAKIGHYQVAGLH